MIRAMLERTSAPDRLDPPLHGYRLALAWTPEVFHPGVRSRSCPEITSEA